MQPTHKPIQCFCVHDVMHTVCTMTKCSYICRDIFQFAWVTIGQLITGSAFIVWRPEVLSQEILTLYSQDIGILSGLDPSACQSQFCPRNQTAAGPVSSMLANIANARSLLMPVSRPYCLTWKMNTSTFSASTEPSKG